MKKFVSLKEVQEQGKYPHAVLCTLFYQSEGEEYSRYYGVEEIFYAPLGEKLSGHVKRRAFHVSKPEDYEPSVDCDNITVIVDR